MLVDLLPLVRMDHVIPANNDVLSNAIKRGLVSTPPSHMMADETHGLQGCAWIRGKNSGMYVKPRLFMPYYEEIKVRCVSSTNMWITDIKIPELIPGVSLFKTVLRLNTGFNF